MRRNRFPLHVAKTGPPEPPFWPKCRQGFVLKTTKFDPTARPPHRGRFSADFIINIAGYSSRHGHRVTIAGNALVNLHRSPTRLEEIGVSGVQQWAPAFLLGEH